MTIFFSFFYLSSYYIIYIFSLFLYSSAFGVMNFLVSSLYRSLSSPPVTILFILRLFIQCSWFSSLLHILSSYSFHFHHSYIFVLLSIFFPFFIFLLFYSFFLFTFYFCISLYFNLLWIYYYGLSFLSWTPTTWLSFSLLPFLYSLSLFSISFPFPSTFLFLTLTFLHYFFPFLPFSIFIFSPFSLPLLLSYFLPFLHFLIFT